MWQALELNLIIVILVRDRRDTRRFGSRCCKNIRRGNFTKTLTSNTANGKGASQYSRCAQQSVTPFYLASPILLSIGKNMKP